MFEPVPKGLHTAARNTILVPEAQLSLTLEWICQRHAQLLLELVRALIRQATLANRSRRGWRMPSEAILFFFNSLPTSMT